MTAARWWIDVLTFRGAIGRRDYSILALAVLATHHVLIALVTWDLNPGMMLIQHLSLAPWMVGRHDLPVAALMLANVAEVCVMAWLLGAASFCRAGDARLGGAVATLAVVPVLQVFAIVCLAFAPTKATPWTAAESSDRQTSITVAQGTVAGGALALFGAVIGALAFGDYGWTMFVISPFLVGAATGAIANWRAPIGAWATVGLTLMALLLSALALLGLALEGFICLALAFLPAALMGALGAVISRAFVQSSRHPARTTAVVVGLIPLLYLGEVQLDLTERFQTSVSRDIDAPPAAVWRSITHMGAISESPSLPFQLGLAYPTSGVIRGEGVGAIREGHFSTGIAFERVTDWQPERRLAFKVLSDPPTMSELSPYRNVDAPHDSGYFRTLDAVFTLEPLPGGRTRLTLTTHHELDAQPAIYWGPIARWAVFENKVRVLRHFAEQAEDADVRP